MKKKGLGKGLEALLPSMNTAEKEVQELKINTIDANTEQPRKHFDKQELKKLAESIKNHGVVQPIIVTKQNEGYKIIAGERRWRAAKIAGLQTIPAILKEYADKEALEVALIENIQRQDLNPIEEAEAFRRLSEEYKLKQENIANSVGKSRSAITNALRLLTLDERVKDMVSTGRISGGHARVLITINDKNKQYELAQELEKKKMSVRDTEKYIKKYQNKRNIKKTTNQFNYIEKDISEKLRNILGTKVQLMAKKNRGKIIIEYYSNEELERILDIFNKTT